MALTADDLVRCVQRAREQMGALDSGALPTRVRMPPEIAATLLDRDPDGHAPNAPLQLEGLEVSIEAAILPHEFYIYGRSSEENSLEYYCQIVPGEDLVFPPREMPEPSRD